MSNAISVIQDDIYGTKDSFQAVLADRSISFEREANFAVQILANNDYALGLAMKNRQAVVNAVTNLAAIGLSLNPAKKQAYLVPRKTGIVLEIGYIGLVELAIASGSVRWVKAELVREADEFTLCGLDKLPAHKFSPFDRNRGEVVGAYCVAKTIDGDYLTESMNVDELNSIRDRSESWKSGQKGPWKTDYTEMCKKTVVKRASKLWPKTDRLDQAIHHLNTDGEEGFTALNDDPVVEQFNVDSYLIEVGAASDLQTLERVWKKGIGAAGRAGDKMGGHRLKTAVIARKAVLEGTIDA